MSRSVDQVEFERLPARRVVFHADGVQLDGDATFPLEVHGVQQLVAHEAPFHRMGRLDETVGQGGFTVVDMGHDTEVADVGGLHAGNISEGVESEGSGGSGSSEAESEGSGGSASSEGRNNRRP